MFQHLTKSALALGLSVAIGLGTLGATATPARADNQDAARILGGILALYAVGRIIHESSNRNDAPQQAHVTPPPRQQAHQPQRPRQQAHQPHRPRQQAHQPQRPRQQAHQPHRPRALVAPSRCFIDGHDGNGYFRGYVRRCMQNNVARPAALPANCLSRVWTQRGQRMIYGGRCLARNGWVRG